MRGFSILVIFTFVYLLLLIVIHDTWADPRGVEGTHPQSKQDSSQHQQATASPEAIEAQNSTLNNNTTSAKFGHEPCTDRKTSDSIAADPTRHQHPEQVIANNENNAKSHPSLRAQPQNSSNPIVNMFQITDPSTVNAVDAVYGSYNGDDQCSRKSACIMGNSMKDMPGRDLFFILLGGYIPTDYRLYYDIFRNSALYGQNCDIYVCIPQTKQQGSPSKQEIPRVVNY